MEIRRVLRLGNSRAITLPRNFPHVDYCIIEEKEEGRIIIRPLWVTSPSKTDGLA